MSTLSTSLPRTSLQESARSVVLNIELHMWILGQLQEKWCGSICYVLSMHTPPLSIDDHSSMYTNYAKVYYVYTCTCTMT